MLARSRRVVVELLGAASRSRPVLDAYGSGSEVEDPVRGDAREVWDPPPNRSL